MTAFQICVLHQQLVTLQRNAIRHIQLPPHLPPHPPASSTLPYSKKDGRKAVNFKNEGRG